MRQWEKRRESRRRVTHHPHVVGGRQGRCHRRGKCAGGHRDHARIAVTLSSGGPPEGEPPEDIRMRNCPIAPSTRITARGRRGCSGTTLLLICDNNIPAVRQDHRRATCAAPVAPGITSTRPKCGCRTPSSCLRGPIWQVRQRRSTSSRRETPRQAPRRGKDSICPPQRSRGLALGKRAFLDQL